MTGRDHAGKGFFISGQIQFFRKNIGSARGPDSQGSLGSYDTLQSLVDGAVASTDDYKGISTLCDAFRDGGGVPRSLRKLGLNSNVFFAKGSFNRRSQVRGALHAAGGRVQNH